MKKMMMALTAAAALAVPVGVIVAADDSTDPVDPAPASVEPDRVLDRDRRNVDEPIPLVEPVANEVAACDGDGSMVRQRDQHRVDDGTGVGPMVRDRDQHRYEDGTGPGPMDCACEQRRLEDSTDDEVTTSTDDQVTTSTDDQVTPTSTDDVSDATDGANLEFQYGQGNGRNND